MVGELEEEVSTTELQGRLALQHVAIPTKFAVRFTNQPTRCPRILTETMVEVGINLGRSQLFEIDAFGGAREITTTLPPTEQVFLVMSWEQALALAEKVHRVVMKRSS